MDYHSADPTYNVYVFVPCSFVPFGPLYGTSGLGFKWSIKQFRTVSKVDECCGYLDKAECLREIEVTRSQEENRSSAEAILVSIVILRQSIISVVLGLS